MTGWDWPAQAGLHCPANPSASPLRQDLAYSIRTVHDNCRFCHLWDGCIKTPKLLGNVFYIDFRLIIANFGVFEAVSATRRREDEKATLKMEGLDEPGKISGETFWLAGAACLQKTLAHLGEV